MEFHWIFAGVLILCFILLFKFLVKSQFEISASKLPFLLVI